jgi:hypothetical protein
MEKMHFTSMDQGTVADFEVLKDWYQQHDMECKSD